MALCYKWYLAELSDSAALEIKFTSSSKNSLTHLPLVGIRAGAQCLWSGIYVHARTHILKEMFLIRSLYCTLIRLRLVGGLFEVVNLQPLHT